ncbi:hypothetical protein [Lysobacter sp. F6437]|uniref:hypothetical protein n=1 Tax=Lysobacter sp. F6437 TaxID=3459296 RepID=UPI00403D88ED
MRSTISLSRTAIAGALLVALVGTAGCSWFRKSNELYAQAPENRPLEVPPDLDLPRTGAAVGAAPGSVTASGTVAAASATTAPPAADPAAAGTAAAPDAVGAAPAPAPVPPAGAATANPAAAAAGFNMAGSRDEAFARVDTALAGIEGVSVASRAKLLGVFDVNYQDVNFLVRVSEVEAGAYVSAVDPRGMPATDAAAVQLIAQLQAALAGN